MISFLFNRRQEPQQAAQAPPSVLTPQNKVIAISTAAEEGFVDVDYKELSYAEAAVLNKSAAGQVVIDEEELGTDISDCQMAALLARKVVVPEKTPAPAAVASTKTRSSKKTKTKKTLITTSSTQDTAKNQTLAELAAVAEALEEEELVYDALYNDKMNRFPSKQLQKKMKMELKKRKMTR